MPLLSPFPLILQQTARVVPCREGGLMGKHQTSQLGGSMCGPVIIYWWWPCLVGHVTQRPVKSVSASNTTAAARPLLCFSSVHFVWSSVVLCQLSPVAQCRPFNHISDDTLCTIPPWRVVFRFYTFADNLICCTQTATTAAPFLVAFLSSAVNQWVTSLLHILSHEHMTPGSVCLWQRRDFLPRSFWARGLVIFFFFSCFLLPVSCSCINSNIDKATISSIWGDGILTRSAGLMQNTHFSAVFNQKMFLQKCYCNNKNYCMVEKRCSSSLSHSLMFAGADFGI